jgi:hypothetical protein
MYGKIAMAKKVREKKYSGKLILEHPFCAALD